MGSLSLIEYNQPQLLPPYQLPSPSLCLTLDKGHPLPVLHPSLLLQTMTPPLTCPHSLGPLIRAPLIPPLLCSRVALTLQSSDRGHSRLIPDQFPITTWFPIRAVLVMSFDALVPYEFASGPLPCA